jgi:transposase
MLPFREGHLMQGRQEYQPELFVSVDIEAMIPKNHLLRRVDRVLDLSFISELTKDFYSSDQGRPSIDPQVFIRMLLISYFYGIDSDRRLCEEIQFNLAYRWFCRLSLNDKVADHSSMTKIRDRFGEETFKKIFERILKLCEERGLVKSGQIMADSSLIKADAALDSLKRVDGIDEGSWHTKGRKYSNQTHKSTSDPEATLTNKTGVHKALYFKAHTSADSRSRVIVDTHVTTGSMHDTVVFKETVKRLLKKIKVKEITADRGYGASENYLFLESQKIKHYIPLWRPQVGQQEEGFKYDSKKDRFRCPEGNYLKRLNNKDDSKMYTMSRKVCIRCPLYETCVSDSDKRNGRGKRLRRHIHQKLFNQVLWREQKSLFKQKLHHRMWSMEGLFAEGKNFHTLDRARYRGRAKLQIQAYMIASVQNLKRLVAIPALIIDFLSSWLRNLEKFWLKIWKPSENLKNLPKTA